jgi:hypothetical protein
MRNQKQKNEPAGLTGGKLGSWRYNQMMIKQRAANKKYRKEKREYEKEHFVYIENDLTLTFILSIYLKSNKRLLFR